VSYAAFGLGPSTPPPCGDQAILDPYTGLCHCSDDMVRDPRAPNDCVDPSLVCPNEGESWDETRQQCVTTLPPVIIVGTKPKQQPSPTGGGSSVPPAQAGMLGANSGFWWGAAAGAVILSVMKMRGMFDH
jgi:hypothetical protein